MLKDYLRAQFEMYPQQFRDVSAFMADASVREQVMRETKALPCPRCGAGVCQLSAHATKGGDSRYRYTCNSCTMNSGELQKSPAIAYWLLFAKKDAKTNPVLPIVQSDRYAARAAHWHRVPAGKAQRLCIEWISSTKWVKFVWSQHRQSDDYQQLCLDDRCYVDAIGAVMDVLKKDAVQLALSLGVDVQDPSRTKALKLADAAVQQDRARRFPLFQMNITSGLKQRAQGMLGV